VTSEYRWIEERVWECDDETSGDGSQGDWKGFFNVPKNQKAQALASAIKGVGLSTAQKLVDDNSFSSKPRSWSAFARVINDADDRYKTGFSYDVVVKYKKENMTDLGYIVEGKCDYVTKRVFRRVPVRKFHHTEEKDFLVTVSNAPLLSGEEESFTVVFDGFDSRVAISSRYNNYEVTRHEEGTRTVFELIGERQKVSPPNGLSIQAKRDGKRLVLTINDKNFSSDLDPDAKRFVKIEVKKDGILFFNKKLAELEAELNGDDSITVLDDINASVKSGDKILIKYTLEHRDSLFYNTKKSSQEIYKTKL
jgi:hypothetical protein